MGKNQKPSIFLYGYSSQTEIGQKLHPFLTHLGIPFYELETCELSDGIESLLKSFTETKRINETLISSKVENPFILFCFFENQDLNFILNQFNLRGMCPIPLKAMLTENNQKWSFKELQNELIEEHQMILKTQTKDSEEKETNESKD